MVEATPSPHAQAPTGPASVHDLRTLVLSRHPAVVLDTADEDRAEALAGHVAYELGVPAYEWTITRGLAPLGQPGGMYGSQEPAKALAAIAELSGDALFVLKDFTRHLTDAVLSRAFRDLLETFAAPHRQSTVLLVGTGAELPAEVRPHVVAYTLHAPTRAEYRAVVDAVATSLIASRRARVDLQDADRDALAGAVRGLTLNQARQAIARVAIQDGLLHGTDLPALLAHKARTLASGGLLEFFPAEDNPAELGGFGRLTAWLERAALARTPQAAALDLPAPRGILLAGVQGCGKSLAAKYVARVWNLPLVKLDAARLYDKFIGETERHLRQAIATAEAVAPVVLWIDELEKAFPSSSGGDGDAGVSARLLGSFLTWLQEKRADVFVVATANDVGKLPPELMRKGRFDETFFVDLPETLQREAILRIHLKLRKQDTTRFHLPSLAIASAGFSGAELEQVVISALLRALQDGVPLDTPLLADELAATVPLSRSRAEEIEALRAWAAGRFVPVG